MKPVVKLNKSTEKSPMKGGADHTSWGMKFL
jgi:hypothetical protein